MTLTTRPFTLADQVHDCFLIQSHGALTAPVAEDIRTILQNCLDQAFPIVYLDVRAAREVDLSGVNEIIHSHYLLQQAGKQLVLVYRQSSPVAKWVATTGLHRFIATAVVPNPGIA